MGEFMPAKWDMVVLIYYITNKKNNCLMKSEVGMAVLKSKQTRVVGVVSTYV